METIILNHITWMDFSGSPTLFIPEKLADQWMGFYDTTPEPDAIDTTPDLVINKQAYYVNAAFDFDNPKTDYDQVCQKLLKEKSDVVLYPVRGGDLLAISSYYDYLGWDTQSGMFFNGALEELQLKTLEELNWKKIIEWTIDSEPVYMINACLCPLDFENNVKGVDFQVLSLSPGKYHIEFANYEYKYTSMLYRFVLV